MLNVKDFQRNLIACVIASLVSACSAFPFARRCPCEEVILPPPPSVVSCIANESGTMFCNGELYPVVNNICRPASQDAELFKWIDFAVSATGGN